MKLIIGLGNPGKQYEKTRHNAGFIVIDELSNQFGFSEFRGIEKFKAKITEGQVNGEKIILAKPETFMNLSGQSVRIIIDFYKISIEDIIVVYDDLDIDLGSYKISIDCSAGGHNGIQSIIESLGTQKFKRFRIGIEGAEMKKNRVMSGSDFVLQNFNEEELLAVKNLAKELVNQI